jgi:hypothetical protein
LGSHLDDLEAVVHELFLWGLNDGNDFRLDGIPHMGKGAAGSNQAVSPEMVQVWIDGELIVRSPISEMKTCGDGKVGLQLVSSIGVDEGILSRRGQVEPRDLPC